jgi:DNA helicase II / ATP-dependent DNA helicase PcrA
MRQISDWKTRGVAPVDAVKHVGVRAGDAATGPTTTPCSRADAYGRYEETLRACGAVDFDDLLLLTVKLLREPTRTVRQALWKRWHYFMIDEYQDTNAVQLEMARVLAGPRRNLCVVGDDDQSIYAFRGADVGNILEFERHFPGTAVIRLEQNYRSTQRILRRRTRSSAATSTGTSSSCTPATAIGALLDLYAHETEQAEAETVAREIQVRRMTRKMRWEDFAVLYRTNPQSRVLEEALRAQNIPYRVVGGTSFFERKEVLDCWHTCGRSWRRRRRDRAARIINYPPRGIGRTTVLKLADLARERRIPFGTAAGDCFVADAGAGPAAAVHAFQHLLETARMELRGAEAAAAHAAAVAGRITAAGGVGEGLLRKARYRGCHPARAWYRSAIARVANVRDLVGTIARYERIVWDEAGSADWEPPSLSGALARLTLAEMDNTEDEPDTELGGVTLMTLHSAKGLEFSDVFIVGLEEGILPHARSLAAEDGGSTAIRSPRSAACCMSASPAPASGSACRTA